MKINVVTQGRGKENLHITDPLADTVRVVWAL